MLQIKKAYRYLIIKLKSFGKSNLAKESGIYTLSSILEKAIPFLLLPVLTRYLSTEDYGIVSMFLVLIGLTQPFTGFNTHSAVFRNYYKEKIDLPVYIANALFIMLGSSAIVVGVFVLFSDLISEYSEFPESWLLIVVLVSSTQFLVNLALVIWQAQKKPFRYGLFKVLLSMLNMGLAIMLIVGLGYGWEGRVLSQVIAYFIFGVLGFFFLYQNDLIEFKWVRKYLRHALSYGVPLIPHVLSTFAITMIDRVFITNMVGVSDTGIYTVGYQIGMIIGVLASSFNKAWTPWLFEKLNEGKQTIKNKIVRLTYAYFVVIICLALGLSLLAPWFMQYLVGENFYSATNYIIWIAFGYSFNGMYFMVTNYIFYEEKTHLLSWVTFAAAVINIGLNYFLIKAFGAIGAAQATTLTYLIQFFLTWYLAARVYKMPWNIFEDITKDDNK